LRFLPLPSSIDHTGIAVPLTYYCQTIGVILDSKPSDIGSGAIGRLDLPEGRELKEEEDSKLTF